MKKNLLFFTILIFSATIFADSANWMAQIPDNRIMNQLMIPGTHDSGSYAITPNSLFSLSKDDPFPTWVETISNILPISITRFIFAGWAKTQPHSIAEQLKEGVRYFDLRVCYFQPPSQSPNFYLCHTLIANTVSSELQQIQYFINEHPSEIILLDFNHIYGIDTDAKETQFIKILQQYCGENAIPNTYSPSNTIGELRRSHRNVIILMDVDHLITDPSVAEFAAHYVWHQKNIDSPWPNITTDDELKQKLDSEINFRANMINTATNFFVLQMIKTENTAQVLDGILDSKDFPNSIHRYEKTVDDKIPAWLAEYNAEYGLKPINIVIQDWLTDHSPLLSIAIANDMQPINTEIQNTNNDPIIQDKLARVKKMFQKSNNNASSR